ncbi:methyltransferase domain-containing protein [candidate division TA06 bacterium]|nr:methyltransferase domain-containing protein [candidate division TA06 bacterium]
MRKPAKNKWAKERYKRRIIDQRKLMWEPEYVTLLSRWTGFKHGQTVVDVGCGLGYLGTLYWQYFGKGGKYCGVDISPKLVTEAKKLSLNWAKGGTTEFKTGDAYKLPYPDNFADVVICQTMLMHLSNPQKAVNEMHRILKPGGTVLCKEPDNLSMSLQHTITSEPELPIKDELFFHKISILCSKGNAALGLGHYNAAQYVPQWLKIAGFTKIDAKINSQPLMAIPPYETPKQKMVMENWRKELKIEEKKNEKRQEMRKLKKLIIAGGGNTKDYERYLSLKSKYRCREKLYKRHVQEGSYYVFCARQFFAIKGCKTK